MSEIARQNSSAERGVDLDGSLGPLHELEFELDLTTTRSGLGEFAFIMKQERPLKIWKCNNDGGLYV